MATINVKIQAMQSLSPIWQGLLAELAAAHAPLQISNDGAPHAPYLVSRASIEEEVTADPADPTKDNLVASLSIDLTSV